MRRLKRLEKTEPRLGCPGCGAGGSGPAEILMHLTPPVERLSKYTSAPEPPAFREPCPVCGRLPIVFTLDLSLPGSDLDDELGFAAVEDADHGDTDN